MSVDKEHRVFTIITTMGVFKTVFWGSTFGVTGGYILLHTTLKKKYPEIPLWDLPKSSRIQRVSEGGLHFKDRYIAYYDNYKVNLRTTKTAQELTDEFLNYPLLSSIIDNGNGNQSSLLTSKISEQTKAKNYESTIIKWNWNSPSFTQFFNTLCRYGYPWRLMNGGYHEILVEKLDDGTTDVFFCTAHEYDFKREGKILPSLALMLHRDYARVILHQVTGKYE